MSIKYENQTPHLQSDFFAGGLQLDFYPDQLEAIMAQNNQDPYSIAKRGLAVLMMGWPKQGSWGNLISYRAIRAIFFKRDPELLRGARMAFQEGLYHLYEQIKNKSFSEPEQRQLELYLSNCLCFFPFFDPTPYESITCPAYIDKQWVLVEYKVTPIELTPTSGFGALFLGNNGRVFAYGLEPLSHKNTQPHLIFMGTTYPQGQGLSTQLRADMNAFRTAGDILYQNGRERILKWMDKQTHRPHVCGISLGGSLALLLAIDVGDRISRVDALNPAGLYTENGAKQDHWDHLSSKPPVFIQRQEQDPISRLGYWKKDWHILQVKAPEDLKGSQKFADHGLNYAGFKKTKFFSVNAQKDNEVRRWQSRIFYAFSRNIVYYTLLIPYFYIIRPIISFLKQQPFSWIPLLTLLIATPLTSGITAFLFTGISCIALCHQLLQFCMKLAQRINKNSDDADCHRPTLERNPSLDLYQQKTKAVFSKKELQDYQALFGNQPDTLSTTEETPETCILEASKAKIHHIKRTLYFLNEWSKTHSKKEVMKTVEEEHTAYLKGLNA